MRSRNAGLASRLVVRMSAAISRIALPANRLRSCGLLSFLVALSLAAALVHPAVAADYPAKTLTLIVPFPAGGRTDVIGRIVAQGLAKKSETGGRGEQAGCQQRTWG